MMSQNEMNIFNEHILPALSFVIALLLRAFKFSWFYQFLLVIFVDLYCKNTYSYNF